MSSLIQQMKDPYDRKARLTPALLVAVPVLIPLVCVYGPRHPVLVAVVGLLASCGVMYALASIARGRGKKLEERLVQKWGGMPTTIALRHRDRFLDGVTTRRYHERVVSKLGIDMPTAEQEASDPVAADDAYTGATRRLRELTRGNKALLLTENIAYGFHRNMLAMRGPGVASSVIGLFYGLVIARVISFTPIAIKPVNLADPGLPAGLTLAVSVLLLLSWLFYFDEDKVRRIGFVYAERLLECLETLPGKRGGRVRKASGEAQE